MAAERAAVAMAMTMTMTDDVARFGSHQNAPVSGGRGHSRRAAPPNALAAADLEAQ